jgi:hypothetical protein
MSKRTVWAVEFWGSSGWAVAVGGLNKAEALRQAKAFAKSEGQRVSIAEYTQDEGSSAISRQAVG